MAGSWLRKRSGASRELLAATAETNAARLALRRKETAQASALLTRAVETLERLPPSYERGVALVPAGSAVFEGEGRLPHDIEAVAVRAFRTAVRKRPMRCIEPDRPRGIRRPASIRARAVVSLGLATASPGARYRGQTDAALTAYRRALAELQSVPQDIPVEYRDGRSSYRATFGPVYLQFSDMLLRRASPDPNRAASLIREARDTIEQLKEDFRIIFGIPLSPVFTRGR
jgi:hypothetical protein